MLQVKLNRHVASSQPEVAEKDLRFWIENGLR